MCFTDYDKALELEADLVVIVMPHYAHIDFAKKAVLAGKDVLIEKPLCDDLDEAKEFAEWMKGRKERVFVSQNYRYRDELWQIRHGINNGELGELQFVELDYRTGMTTDPQEHVWNIQGWRGKQACMQAYEVCIHHFDMFRFLTGSNVKSLYADGWNPKWAITRGPESFFVNLEFENGAHILFSNHMSSVGAPPSSRATGRSSAAAGWSPGAAPRASSSTPPQTIRASSPAPPRAAAPASTGPASSPSCTRPAPGSPPPCPLWRTTSTAWP